MRRIAVVGAGLAGLSVAFRCARHGHRVTVFESAARPGGQLATAREDGWVVELGAEGFVARSEVVPELARDLGMCDPEARGPALTMLLDQRETTSFRFEDGRLRALAPGEAAEALRFQVAPSHKGAGIRTFVGGMQMLSDSLVAALGASAIRLGHHVRSIRTEGAGVAIDGEIFDAAVIATTSASVARLLGADDLLRAETLSSVTVSLGYAREQVAHPLDGTGFVVGEPFEGFRACTFTSSKFAYRVPEGFVSLRVFFRPTADELGEDVPWVDRAARVLGQVLPIAGPPQKAWVSRWVDALPVLDEDHRKAVALHEGRLLPRAIHLAGSAFHGSGIDAAVRSAETVAARLNQS